MYAKGTAPMRGREFQFVCGALLLLAGGAGPLLAQPEVRGVVTRENGEAAPFVELVLEISDMRLRRPVATERLRAGPDGGFVFDLSEYGGIPRLGLELSTQSPRFRDTFAVEVLAFSQLPVEMNLMVAPGSVVQGRVVDDEGTPLEAATVAAPGTRGTTTNGQGRFELFGIGAEGMTRLTASKRGFLDASITVTSEQPQLIEGVELVLTPAARLQGMVVDPAGEPVGGGQVVLLTEDQRARTMIQPDGRFVFRAAPEDLTQARVLVATNEYFFPERPFTEEEDSSREVKLEVLWPVRLGGVLQAPEGAPVSGSEIVVLSEDGGPGRRFPVDEEGRWEAFPFEPGQTVRLLAVAPRVEGRQGMGVLNIEMAVEGGWKGSVDPWPKGFRSSFSVDYDKENPQTIRLLRRDEGLGALPGEIRYEGTIDEGFKRMEGTLTVPALEATGRWMARALSPSGGLWGLWDLRETIEGGAYSAAPVRVEVQAAPMPGLQYVDVSLRPPGKLRGRVLLPDGSPVIDGRVRVVAWDGEPGLDREARITAGGGFELGGLPPGLLELEFIGWDGDQPLRYRGWGRAGAEDLVMGPADLEDPMDPVVSLRRGEGAPLPPSE